ncbi:MAG: response regulator [candidate division WOR-3 bacterium]
MSDSDQGQTRKRILLVEDEINMQELVKYRLRENNYDVAIAADGYSALSMVRSYKPDLVILDLMLPKIDGYTICRLLKFNEGSKSIPVLILSARSSQDDIQRGLDMGADAYMTKPYEPADLLAKIKELLEKKPEEPPSSAEPAAS